MVCFTERSTRPPNAAGGEINCKGALGDAHSHYNPPGPGVGPVDGYPTYQSQSLLKSTCRRLGCPCQRRRRAAGRCRFWRRERHGRVRCWNHRMERRRIRAAETSGEVEQVASVLAEALNTQSPTGRLHSEAVSSMLSVSPDLKTQIPDEHGPEGGTCGEKNHQPAGDAGRCPCLRPTFFWHARCGTGRHKLFCASSRCVARPRSRGRGCAILPCGKSS